jgi:hypothetical protein
LRSGSADTTLKIGFEGTSAAGNGFWIVAIGLRSGFVVWMLAVGGLVWSVFN